ncbi:type I phosphomannose isomerase catalytic subunit [Treponema sp. OMZ 805]|uniref:type I phosphomannose isomerase catalytic subunit n=1 Tax=Treponema sp. OMZ 805 TaxID=2726068 RepID=UPI003D91A0C0
MQQNITMFKTQPFISEKVWGYERWIVSVHPAGKSLVDDAAAQIGGTLLDAIVGASYPLLIKIIQANETLSVQVHPDDNYAYLHEHSAGKTECWYVLDAVPDAKIIYGLQKDYRRSELETAIRNNTLERCLRSVPVSKGDFIFIPAGTVHAIQGGLRLLEVQQSSDITYRLYDWGRPREVHIQKGLDVLRYLPKSTLTPEHPFSGKTVCPYFRLEKKDFPTTETISFSAFDTPAAKTGWCSLFIISGNGMLETAGVPALQVKTEDCIVVRREAAVSVLPDRDSLLSVMLMG